MSQVSIPNGIILGAPGPGGSPSVYHFCGPGDPNLRSDPLSLLGNCSVGSMYSRTDPPDTTHALYIKPAKPTATTPNGIWTAK